MRPILLALILTLGSFAANGQSPDCQFTQTFTTTGYGVTVANRAVSNLMTQCTTWRLSYYADGMTALSIQIEGAPDSSGSAGTFAAIPNTVCSSTQQPPCLLDGSNPLTTATNDTVAFRGYYPWIALHVTVFTPTGKSGTITARMYGYKGTSPSASNRGSGIAAIACVGTPGNTIGAYRQQCQDSTGALYACNNAAGCTVAGDWVAQGGGGGTGDAGATVTVSPSATPVFICPSATASTSVLFNLGTLGTAITSATTSGCPTSAALSTQLSFSMTEAVGAYYAVAWPAGFVLGQPAPAYNGSAVTTVLTCIYDGSIPSCVPPNSANLGPGMTPEITAPTTAPQAGSVACWADSTSGLPRCELPSGVITQGSKELTAGNIRAAGGANAPDTAATAAQVTALTPWALAGTTISPATTTNNVEIGAKMIVGLTTAGDLGAKLISCLATAYFCDASGLTGAQTISSTVVVGAGKTVLLGVGTITSAVLPAFTFASGTTIKGTSSDSTFIVANGVSESVIRPVAGGGVTQPILEHFSVSNTTSTNAGGIALNLTGVSRAIITDVVAQAAERCVVLDAFGYATYFNELYAVSTQGCTVAIDIDHGANEAHIYGGVSNIDATGIRVGHSAITQNVKVYGRSFQGDTAIGLLLDTYAQYSTISAPTFEGATSGVTITNNAGNISNVIDYPTFFTSAAFTDVGHRATVTNASGGTTFFDWKGRGTFRSSNAYTTGLSGLGTVGEVISTDSAAADVGPILALGGESGQASTPYMFGSLKCAKTGGGVANYGGYCGIWTVAGALGGGSDSAPYERLRVYDNGGVALLPYGASAAQKTAANPGALNLSLPGAIATLPILTTALPTCTATTGTPWRATVSDAVAPALGVVLTGGGGTGSFANVHCSLTSGTYIVDGI